ncbi:MAG: DUF5320 domain-containing protein [Phycisphaerae bacterium]
MPGGDRTGPAGMGPMSGRAAGFCAGYPAPGYANPAGGRGFWGWGRGRRGGGRGRRNWYHATGLPGWQRAAMGAPAWGAPPAPPAPGAYPPPGAYPAAAPEDEAEALKAQAEQLQQALEDIRSRLDELQAEGDSEKE